MKARMTFARVPRLAAICLTTSLMSAMATADPVAIDIKSEPLPTALKEFARQTRVQVAVQSELTAGKTSSTVSGKYEPADALAALLKGTGLVAYPVNANTYGIRAISGDGPPGFTGKPSTGVVTPGTPVVQLTQTATAGANQTGGPVAPEPASADSGKKDDLSEIVVTGTHIRGAPLSSPVIEITQVDIERSGYTNVGDVIRSLPQNFSGGNNPQNIGSNPFANDNSDNAGTSPNLRGLGSGSTLTLVNGHRLADDTSDGGTDISFIPLAAIERIDILTDGASAAYGADAVGGVVNFILKKDFDGAQSGALIGNATDGGAHEVQFNQLLGKTWDGGGALLAGRYDKQDPVYASQRDFAELAAQPLSLLPGSEVKSYFLSAHQEISSYFSAFVEALYGTRSAASVSTFPASDNRPALACGPRPTERN